MLTNKERLEANNRKIEEITKALAKKQVSPTDMLQARVDATNSCNYLFYYYGGTNLDFIKNLDTRNVIAMYHMFEGCSSLTSLDLSNFDTSKVVNMSNMFQICIKLTSLDVSSFNTSNVTNMYAMFQGCLRLTDIVGTLDMIKVTNMNYMFGSCEALTNVTLKNIKTSLQIGRGTSYGHLLTLDCLINTIKELWDYSSGTTTYTLTIGSANLEKIANTYVKLITPTEEQIAQDPNIVNKKPCVVCESTDEGAMTLTEYATSKKWALA